MPYDDLRFARNRESLNNNYPLNQSTEEIIGNSSSRGNMRGTSSNQSKSEEIVRFCPECGSFLAPKTKYVYCPNCRSLIGENPSLTADSIASDTSKTTYYEPVSETTHISSNVDLYSNNETIKKSSSNTVKTYNQHTKNKTKGYKNCPSCNSKMSLKSYMGYPKCPKCGYIDSPHIPRSKQGTSRKTSQYKTNKVKSISNGLSKFKSCPHCKEPMSLKSVDGYPKCSLCGYVDRKKSVSTKSKTNKAKGYKNCPSCNSKMSLKSYMGYPKCPKCGYIDSPHIPRSKQGTSRKTSQYKTNKVKSISNGLSKFKSCPHCKEPMSLKSFDGYPKCPKCGYVDRKKSVSNQTKTKTIKVKSDSKKTSKPKPLKAKAKSKEINGLNKPCPNCHTRMSLVSYMGYPKCPKCGYIDNPNIIRSKPSSNNKTTSTENDDSTFLTCLVLGFVLLLLLFIFSYF